MRGLVKTNFNLDSSSIDDELWPLDRGSCLGYYFSRVAETVSKHYYLMKYDLYQCCKETKY